MNDTAITEGVPEDKLGSVGKLDDGRTFVLFHRRLPHTIDKVWAAITEPAQLAKWAPGIRFELKQRGAYEIWFGGECEGPAHVSGKVVEYDPPRVLQLGTIRFELEADGDGCLLRFSDVLVFEGARSQTEIANSVLGGWHQFLDQLEDALNDQEVDFGLPEVNYAAIDIPGRP